MKAGIERLYYSITEVSKMLDEEQHVLRYWEREFSQLRPQKNRAGNRVYTNKDLAVLTTIKKLLREKRYTVAGAKEHLRHYTADELAEEAFNRQEQGALDEGTENLERIKIVAGTVAAELRELATKLRKTNNTGNTAKTEIE